MSGDMSQPANQLNVLRGNLKKKADLEQRGRVGGGHNGVGLHSKKLRFKLSTSATLYKIRSVHVDTA